MGGGGPMGPPGGGRGGGMNNNSGMGGGGDEGKSYTKNYKPRTMNHKVYTTEHHKLNPKL